MHKKRKLPDRIVKKKQINKIKPIKRPTQTLVSKIKHHQQFKKIVFAISSSLIIGLVFGLITLKMLKQEDPEQANILNSSASKQEEQSEENITQFDSIGVYVIQGGVFSEKENASQWAETFN